MATTNDPTRYIELEVRVADLTQVIAELEGAMAACEETKTVIGDEVLEELNAADKRLNTLIGKGRYDGVEYEDDTTEPCATTATAPPPAAGRFMQLKARVEALGHKLIEDDWCEKDMSEGRDSPGLYVLDPKTDKLVLVHCGGDRSEDFDEIEGWCESREREAVFEFFWGDIELPKELAPARALFAKLVQAAEKMSAEEIREALARTDSDIGVAGVSTGDAFMVMESNLTRRGLSFRYALLQLGWIVRGSEAAPAEGGAA